MFLFYYYIYILWIPYFNSSSAKGSIEVFANNTDSCESARNELSHMKSAWFAFYFINNSPKLVLQVKQRRPILNTEESTLNNSALKELKPCLCTCWLITSVRVHYKSGFFNVLDSPLTLCFYNSLNPSFIDWSHVALLWNCYIFTLYEMLHVNESKTKLKVCFWYQRWKWRHGLFWIISLFSHQVNNLLQSNLKWSVFYTNIWAGLHRLIWFDTLRRVHNVGFLTERLIHLHNTFSWLNMCSFNHCYIWLVFY